MKNILGTAKHWFGAQSYVVFWTALKKLSLVVNLHVLVCSKCGGSRNGRQHWSASWSPRARSETSCDTRFYSTRQRVHNRPPRVNRNNSSRVRRYRCLPRVYHNQLTSVKRKASSRTRGNQQTHVYKLLRHNRVVWLPWICKNSFRWGLCQPAAHRDSDVTYRNAFMWPSWVAY